MKDIVPEVEVSRAKRGGVPPRRITPPMTVYVCESCRAEEDYDLPPTKCRNCGKGNRLKPRGLTLPRSPSKPPTNGELSELPKFGQAAPAPASDSDDSLPAVGSVLKPNHAGVIKQQPAAVPPKKGQQTDTDSLPDALLPPVNSVKKGPGGFGVLPPPIHTQPSPLSDHDDHSKTPATPPPNDDETDFQIDDKTEPDHKLETDKPRPGTLLWKYKFPSKSRTCESPGKCIAVDSQGTMYAAFENELFALKETTGKEPRVLWQKLTKEAIATPPVIGPDGAVRVHSHDGLVHCFDAKGEPVWPPVYLGEPLSGATPAVDSNNNTWVSLPTGGLAKIDSRGKTMFGAYYRSRAMFHSTGLIHNQTLYIGAEDQFVHAIDLTGPRGVNRYAQHDNQGRTLGSVHSAVALLGETGIVVTGSQKRIWAFDWQGQELWKVELPGMHHTSPVVGHGKCYVGVTTSGDSNRKLGQLVCLDAHGGKGPVYDFPHPVVAPPVLGADWMIYVADDQGRVCAFNAKGTTAWTAELNAPVRASGTLVSPGHLVFPLDDGSLVALQCTSETLASGWPKYRGSLSQSGLTA